MKIKIALLAALAAFFQLPELHAQHVEIGIGGGGTYLLGDVRSVDLMGDAGAQTLLPQAGALHVKARQQFNWHWGISAQYSAGQLAASDWYSSRAKDKLRNLQIQTDYSAFDLMAEFNFWPYATGTKHHQTFYITAGIGLIAYNPMGWDRNAQEWVELRPLGTEGQGSSLTSTLPYGLTAMSVPFGMGYRYSVSKNVSMSVELMWRPTKTDYLDDVSGLYIDPVALERENGILAAEMANPSPYLTNPTGTPRGSLERNDWTTFVGLTLYYNLSPFNERCTGF